MISGNESDDALTARLNTGYQIPLENNFGLRFDYFGYADFHEDYQEYDVIDQSVSIEPQYTVGNFIFSLPVAYNYVLEDNKSDYYRYSVSPTTTYRIPNSNQAVAVNILAAKIVDVDNIPDLNENGTSFGGGCAYLIYFPPSVKIRASVDYQHPDYEASVRDYAKYANLEDSQNFSNNGRSDDLLSANIDFQYNFTPHVGLYSSYTFAHAHSNVRVYEYDRSLIETGISLRY